MEIVLSEDFQNDKKDNKVLLRSLNLLKSLLYDEIVEENGKINTAKEDRFKKVSENGIFLSLLKKLSPSSHFDVNERIINIIAYVAQNNYKFSQLELDSLKNSLTRISSIKNNLNESEISLLQKLL